MGLNHNMSLGNILKYTFNFTQLKQMFIKQLLCAKCWIRDTLTQKIKGSETLKGHAELILL